MSSEAVDTDQLVSWKRSLLSKCESLEKTIHEFQDELARTQQQIVLIDRLLGLAGPDRSDDPVSLESQAPNSVVDALEEVLASSGRSLHISEIVEMYRSRGWKIPGRGLDSNLIAYLSRDSRFARVSKGTYGLAQWSSSEGVEK